jgi:DNA-binding response OmpR family regulator
MGGSNRIEEWMRILWVENHPGFVRTAGAQYLASHELVVVPTVAAARRQLQQIIFDAIILDHDLDDGIGPELLPLIVAMTKRPPVIAASATPSGNAALRAAGADETCAKHNFATIHEVLNRAILNRMS